MEPPKIIQNFEIEFGLFRNKIRMFTKIHKIQHSKEFDLKFAVRDLVSVEEKQIKQIEVFGEVFTFNQSKISK